ncbi:microsomal triglyceride transfer protein [Tetranychus urticae]|uniref:microsomal triglyceride transfer protein n=1 Tax=Tetranychus urticae TaxID=32264 RepID=UPI00077BF122|nr:microsomal triglyceride transfer protein [Tetranychus urticae]XP_015785985.1 microsomal triglyceride transfer protein [Tetranychus urticae]XP_015785986.1 microsomal triglyceride transfer protein [Tetranychus urticae]XP_025016774.1 microsomal triglyceride transfer protein [Tetranychus urticae]
MNQIIVMLLKILLLNLSWLINCHPAPSMVLCHGLQLNVKYYYDYWTMLMLNNDDHTGKEPVSFGYKGTFLVENVWQDKTNYVIKVDFTPSSTGHYLDHDGKPVRGPGYGSTNYHSYPLFAHIVDSNDMQIVKSFYRHNKESITSVNLKKAIVSLLRTKKTNYSKDVTWNKKGQDIEQSYSSKTDKIEPIMSPLIIDEWSISTNLGRDHTLVTESVGWQNVSLISRIYNTAYSKLHSRFTLKLNREEKGAKSKLSSVPAISSVFESLGEDYIEDHLLYQREQQTCHNCATLKTLEKDYEEHMSDTEMASIPASIAYLKLVDRVRSGGPGTSKQDIINLLQQRKQKKDVLSSLLDIMAGTRTDQSLSASFEFLDLPRNEDLDICERFLSSLSVSCLTATQSSSDLSLSSLQFIISSLKEIVHVPNWRSNKLKWSTIMTLGTALRAYNTLQINSYVDNHNRDIIQLITTELDNCDDTECRVSLLHAFGNAGNLKLSLKVLSGHAINLKARQESVAALKSIKECLDHLFDKCNSNIIHDNESTCIKHYLTEDELKKLITLISLVIWNEKLESTSRIIATEIATHYIQDDSLVNSILKEVEHFDNFEMSTLMWNRALRHRRSTGNETSKPANWLLHSNRFNGSSASFHKVMGGTGTMNASYGITMELLSKARLLKESAFSFELQSNTSKPQHILTVGLIARGLGSLAGDDGSSSEEETTSAGMILKVLGVQLRPYTFFSGKGELMGHVWSGTASDPITAFSGNLLVSDHQHGYNLINGFVLEQQVRGVLSLELTGEIQISLWNRNSHSIVKAKGSLLVQGSQAVLTSDITTKISQKFAFGGSSSMDLVTDAEFYNLPFKHCLQMHQPELIFRHNTRKYEQIDSDKVNARIHRRNYYIPAKSFAFHRDNNEMCALMNS